MLYNVTSTPWLVTCNMGTILNTEIKWLLHWVNWVVPRVFMLPSLQIWHIYYVITNWVIYSQDPCQSEYFSDQEPWRLPYSPISDACWAWTGTLTATHSHSGVWIASSPRFAFPSLTYIKIDTGVRGSDFIRRVNYKLFKLEARISRFYHDIDNRSKIREIDQQISAKHLNSVKVPSFDLKSNFSRTFIRSSRLFDKPIYTTRKKILSWLNCKSGE